MNSLHLISSILEHITAAREQKANNLALNAGKDPLQDRHNCGAIATYNEIQKKIEELVKSGE